MSLILFGIERRKGPIIVIHSEKNIYQDLNIKIKEIYQTSSDEFPSSKFLPIKNSPPCRLINSLLKLGGISYFSFVSASLYDPYCESIHTVLIFRVMFIFIGLFMRRNNKYSHKNSKRNRKLSSALFIYVSKLFETLMELAHLLRVIQKICHLPRGREAVNSD